MNYEPIAPQEARASKAPWLFLVLVLIGAGIAGWYGWQLLGVAEKTAANAIAARDDGVTRVKAMEEQVAALQAKLGDAAAARDEADAKIRALEQNLSATAAQLEKLKATTTSLEEKLKAEIARGDIKLSQTGDRIQVDLVDKILFDSGEAALTPRGQEVLGRVAAVLKTIEDKQIQVSGHTDDAPITKEELKKQFATNWELSVARAVNVVRYLSETGGVPPKMLAAAGYSQFKPVATNANPKGRAANRRIEILLTPQVVPAKKK